MQLRTAFPTAVVAGAILGAAVVSLNLPTEGESSIFSLVPLEVSEVVTWDLPIVNNEPVRRFLNLFEQEQPDRMALYLKRSGRYEGMIRSKLREQGMPEDLLYLSMIESGFNPNAHSTANAVGLWQFIAGTGRVYGLRIDNYVDERRDPEKSTDAALRYLQDLYNQFGSWSLAAAAYNSGENRVARIMREETGAVRGVENDFWRIRSRLPSETREYVPLIFAAALIGKEPAKYGLESVERLLPVPMDSVMVPGGTPLDVVSRAVGISPEELKQLNQHLLLGSTPPGNAAYPVKVPEGSAQSFAANFASAQAAARTAPAAPPAASSQPSASHDAASSTPAPVVAPTTYRVRNGESLWMIARKHGVSVASLQRVNNLGLGTTIQPGQVLKLPA